MASILVVDDDSDLCQLINLYLIEEQHAVMTIHDGLDGYARLQRDSFDLAILDWDLPGMAGIDILKNHRQSGGETPIIMLTARDSVDDKSSGLDLGANDYLTKPFHSKELQARVRSILRNHPVPKVPKSFGTGNSNDVLIGTTLGGKYKIESLIGGGGYGLIYKAKHQFTRKTVAIKILFPHIAVREKFLKRFEREARSASLLNHPNVVAIYDFSPAADEMPYIVMEYLDGKTLAKVLADEGPIALKRGLAILMQICDGLKHAHSAGVIHRDIKPQNVILISGGDGPEQVKIVDFGLAKPKSDDEEYRSLTQTGELFGSPLYISPEQCLGTSVDHRTDIYSLGCLIYETLSGKPPFVGITTIDTIQKHVTQPIPELRITGPTGIQAKLQSVITRALAKKPELRYQSVQELKADLEVL